MDLIYTLGSSKLMLGLRNGWLQKTRATGSFVEEVWKVHLMWKEGIACIK